MASLDPVSCKVDGCDYSAHVLVDHLSQTHQLSVEQYSTLTSNAPVFSAIGKEEYEKHTTAIQTNGTSRRVARRAAVNTERQTRKFSIRNTFNLDLGFEKDDQGNPEKDASGNPILKDREITGFVDRTEYTPQIDPGYVFPVEETRMALLGLELKDNILLVGGTGVGKCLGKGTPVLKYDGTVVFVEHVKNGDLLMGPDSKPRRVNGVTQGTGPLYCIETKRGKPWVCNESHILSLVHTVTGEIIDIPLNDYINKDKKFKHCYKQFSVGVNFPKAEPLPLDPYFLGVWFGDGTKECYINKEGNNTLSGVAVSKPDAEIRQLMYDAAAKYPGLHVNVYGENNCPTYHIATGKGQNNKLLELLRNVVGPDLKIPHQYITSSREDRALFLAGFLDTDGYLANNCYEIIQKRKDYADVICFMVRSLGLRASIRAKEVEGYGIFWRIVISGNIDKLPLRIKRKQAQPRQQIKDVTRTGFEVNPIGTGEYYGFTLDGDGRFLLGDFTVTHNTSLAEQIAARLNYNVVKINFDGCITRQDLLGEWVVKGREMVFQYGILVMAFQMPGTIIILDEWDTISGECSFVLQRPLQREDRKILLMETGGELIPLHPLNVLVATSNTCGMGDDTGLYSQGTKVQNYAQLNRFSMTIQMKYLEEPQEVEMLQKKFPDLKKQECQAFVKAVNTMREGYINGTLSCPVSTRDLLNWCDKYLRLADPIIAARYCITNRMPPEDAQAVHGILTRLLDSEL